MAATMLESILCGVRADLAERKATRSLAQIRATLSDLPPARDATASLTAPGVGLIAEIKRSSPARGDLAAVSHPARLARDFAAAGARMISVVTASHRYKGSLADLDAVRAAVSVPVLCTDFIIDPYQIAEARSRGADLVSLVAGVLDQTMLRLLLDYAESLGMAALVDVRTCEEAQRAVAAGVRLIGVNARDLDTFELDLGRFARIAPVLPPEVIAVAESGVRTVDDLLAYASAGADAVLVGEWLVTSADPYRAAAALVAAGQGEPRPGLD